MEKNTNPVMNVPGTYVLLEGKAAPVFSYEKKPLEITGTIPAVVEYFKNRYESFDESLKQSTMVKYNRLGNMLTLIIDEKHPLADKLSGQIAVSPEFSNFKINTTYYWQVKEFAKFMKMQRSLFHDREEYNIILSKLNNFKANVTADVSNSKDDRGNKSEHFDRKVTTELPETMVLSVELVKGEGRKKILVEIGHEVFESEVKIWFFSNDAQDLINETLNKAFDEALEVFRSKNVPCFEY